MLTSILFYSTTAALSLYIFVHVTWMWWKRKLSFIPSAPNLPWIGSIPYLGGGDSSERHKANLKFDRQFDHLYVVWITGVPIVNIGENFSNAITHLEGQYSGF